VILCSDIDVLSSISCKVLVIISNCWTILIVWGNSEGSFFNLFELGLPFYEVVLLSYNLGWHYDILSTFPGDYRLGLEAIISTVDDVPYIFILAGDAKEFLGELNFLLLA